MCEKKIKVRNGKSMHDEEAHALEHKGWNRRDFLQSAGLFTAGMAATLGGVPVYAMGSAFKMAPWLHWKRIGFWYSYRCGVATMVSIWSSIDLIQSITISGLRCGITEANLWALDAKQVCPTG